MQQTKVDHIIQGIQSLYEATKLPYLENTPKQIQELYAEYRMYLTLFETCKIITHETDIQKMLSQSVDKMIAATGAERGIIILVDKKGGPEIELARNANQKDIPKPEDEFSKKIVGQVLEQQQPVCVPDIEQSPQLRNRKSIARLELRAVACVPIILKKQLLGAIYLDHRSLVDTFDSRTIFFLTQFANQIAIAVDNLRMRRLLENQNDSLEKMLREKYNFEPFIGHHPNIVRIMDLVAQVTDTDATVLIEGETGTGKELVARSLHFNSRRAKKELVSINCGALPENLLESELFGYVKGAFTGAVSDKKGKFEFAHGGTLFLDEIGEMHPRLQVKLLRILQTGEYSPVGSERTRHCNVRIIAATNQDLRSLVAEGKFRNDLYYRLNIVRLTLPPLVERRSDILVLAKHFLEKYRQKMNKPALTFNRSTEQYLLNYNYPGNVRELENIIERATILSKTAQIEPEDLSDEVRSNFSGGQFVEDITKLSFRDAKTKVITNFEKAYISHTLAQSRGVIRQAARIAGIDVKNFYNKMTKLGIQPAEFK